ncbi:KAP family NTPase [Chryseobacterium sp. GMJ5]|uniref:KAP family NTPase n=1 Tax=Chryseobacterium gilvum TaxID=2976534 RepID=A0ABT2VWB4_9FLAO|nr:KAP family NTPase [Chryseobacterium gilvum]MCU7614291.1 KAP family NTPase [Chryseobacterium gilvum]
MQLKNPQIKYSDTNPFEGCLLNREVYAINLTKIIKTYNRGMVIAIDNRWGTGKTTFIEMWRRLLHLNEYGYKTVYFNAWENDFEDEPLTALLGELTTLQAKSSTTFKGVIQAASNFATDVIPVIGKSIATKYLTVEGVDMIEGTLKGSMNLMNKLVDNYTEKKQSLKDFRNELEISISSLSPEKPVIFFVDELDRCRPNYAVSILEKIKHFFNVNNIIFILAIDKKQLGYAINGVYNSDNIDVGNYLKKFFDIEYTLPTPLNSDYIKYLFNHYQIDLYFSEIPLNDQYEFENFKDFFSKAFDKESLRDLEKICAATALSLLLFKDKKVYTILIAFLIYLKFTESEIYIKIQRKDIPINELTNIFRNIAEKLILRGLNSHILHIEGYFYLSYSNYLDESLFNSWIYNRNQAINNRDDLFVFYNEQFRNGLSKRMNLNIFLERIEISSAVHIN